MRLPCGNVGRCRSRAFANIVTMELPKTQYHASVPFILATHDQLASRRTMR
jgi:hypothetical protein